MKLSIESSLIQHFAALEDPRVERSKQHLLIDIMAIAILAVISGADGWIEHSHHHTRESGHGRIEIRHYYSLPLWALSGVSGQHKWTGLLSVGMVICERRLWDKTTIEVRYYISSLPANAQVLAQAVRTHWGIENSVHWTLDVTFKEDACRIRTGFSSQNFALLRRIALNQLQRETSVKSSICMKRYRAAMDNQYAAQVLLA